MSPEQIEHLMNLVIRFADARERYALPGTPAEHIEDAAESTRLLDAIRALTGGAR